MKKYIDKIIIFITWIFSQEYDFSFNNSEIALGIILIVVLLLMLISKNTRKALIDILSCLCNKHFLILYLEILIYGFLMVFILYKLEFWEFIYTKDTLLWILFTATWLSFTTANNRYEKNVFINILKDTFAITIFIEFLLNLYTFPIIIEIIIIVGSVFLTIIMVYIERSSDKNKSDGAYKLITGINSYFGLNIGIYLIIKVFINFNNLLTLETLKSFILPVLLTIMFIPYLYYLLIKISYDELTMFIKLNKKASKRIIFYFKIKMYIKCKFNKKKISHLRKERKHLIVNMETMKDVNNIFKFTIKNMKK